jgi:hypothetical protein
MHAPPKITSLSHLSAFPEHALLIADVLAIWNIVEDELADFLSLFASPDPWGNNSGGVAAALTKRRQSPP